ncbi:site-2 protease family protein [Falsibacillus albus]|uniref:Site-2 protease family protein n=1 Tax=Falsibacillus albus TaxID=2478915 RepID=A0A3L7JYE1_9BACI|nr:site-2 protease family protein [Falsibacillus albus]RLQ93462.1 site-2 protease family protein [Falsibacillus albus]
MGLFSLSIQDISILAAVLLIAFTVHEFAHAFTAYKFGDMTAKKQGRLTLNPISHLDPLGTIFMFIAGFGWARPVPVNRHFFKQPRLASIIVALMGPLSNFLMALIGYAILYFIVINGHAMQLPSLVMNFFQQFIRINLVLFVFNLLPFPPLDGYRIVEDLVSPSFRPKLTQYEQYGGLIFLVLVLIPPLNAVTISPIIHVVPNYFIQSFQTLFSLF